MLRIYGTTMDVTSPDHFSMGHITIKLQQYGQHMRLYSVNYTHEAM